MQISHADPFSAMTVIADKLEYIREMQMETKAEATSSLPKLTELRNQAADGVADFIKLENDENMFTARNASIAKTDTLDGIGLLSVAMDQVNAGEISTAIVRQMVESAVGHFRAAGSAAFLESMPG